jgi:F-type H+-transporting ATPase subunit b
MPPRASELVMAQKDAKQVESIEHVPSGEHGGGFPPFQKETFASQLLWFALVFVALYLLMSRVALPRVSSILEHRRQRIEGDLAEAQGLKDQSDAAITAYEQALADARSRAQALANETRQRAAEQAEASRKVLDAKLNERIADAEKVIADKRAAAMLNVQDIAAEAAVAIVERLIGIAPAGQQIANAVADTLKR